MYVGKVKERFDELHEYKVGTVHFLNLPVVALDWFKL